MTLLDKLRQHAGIPDAYSWATIGLTVVEARAMVDTDDLLRSRIADRDAEITQLRAELAAATRRCTACGRGARELTPIVENGQTVGWLGPTCRQRTAGQDTALPIGGES